MAEPLPETIEGQEPVAEEGQVPDEGEVQPDGQEPKGRTYTEAYVRALRREAADYRTRLSDVEERLQERDDADKSESTKLSERLTTAEARAVAAESRLLRFEVAADRGLDMQAAAFLAGTSREEVEASADELAKLLADKGKPTPPSFDGGARQPAPDDRPPVVAHNDLLLQALGRKPS